MAVVIATGVNADGHREILGLDLITTEDGAGWTAFLRGLVARGLSGVQLVVSDAHGGLIDAFGRSFASNAATPTVLRTFSLRVQRHFGGHIRRSTRQSMLPSSTSMR